jgi:hypothetical protein
MKTLAALFLVALPLQAGTLCFVAPKEKPKCSSADGPKVAIAPADVERTFVWTSSDGKNVVAGVAAPKSESLDLGDKALKSVTLSVRGSKLRGWPSDLRVLLTDPKKHAWGWEIAAKRVESLASLRVAPSQYALTLIADRHLIERRRVDAQNDVALKEIALKPVPAAHGRVVSAKDEAISTATIALPNGDVIANANEQGAFEVELKEPLPENLVVRAPGYGTKFVPLQTTNADADLGAIKLETGHKLTLRIERPSGKSFPVKVLIERNLVSRFVRKATVAERTLEGDADTVVIPDLGASDYEVTVRGKEPLERMKLRVAVEETDVEKTVKIEPFRVDIYAKLGNEPLRDAKISMQMDELPLDEQGHIGGPAWEHGRWSGFLMSKAIGGGQPVNSPDLGADPSRWEISLPARFIKGRLLDADTKEPIRSMQMELLKTYNNSRSYSSVSSDADGRFSVLAAMVGTYELTIQPPDYVARTEKFEVVEDSVTIEKDILVEHGSQVTIEAQWANGAAVASAPAFEGVASDGYNPARIYQLDGAGRLKVAVGKNERRTIYILPREGSFGVAHLDASFSTVRVIVPPPAGALTIHFVDDSGKPTGAAVGLTFNGEPLPYSIAGRLPQPPGRGTAGLVQLVQLPAGTYQVQPLQGRNFEPVGPPKTVGLSAGEATVEITLPKRP